MPKTYTFQTYQYSELGDKAKKTAITKLGELSADTDNSDELIDLFSNRLAERHYPHDHIQFSLSSSQGDGVAFYGDVNDVESLARAVLDDTVYEQLRSAIESGEISIRIAPNRHANHYSHYNCMDVNIRYTDSDGIASAVDELETRILNDLRNLSKELEAAGYTLLDSMRTEEYLIEEAEALELEFTKEGKIAYVSRMDATEVVNP